MNPILVVAQTEFWNNLRKPSFLFATIIVPLIAIVIAFVAGDFSFNPAPETGEESADSSEPDLPETGIVGYVDLSGVIQEAPAPIADRFRAYGDRASADEALRAGEVDAYYVIQEDYLETGEVERVARGMQLDADDTALVQFALISALLEGADPAVGLLARDPVPEALVEHENIGQRAADLAAGGENAGDIAFGIAYTLAMLIYTTTFMSASYLLQSVTVEKETRMMEILLTSARPFQILAGKVLGLGALGLVQTVVWATVAYFVAGAGLFDVSLESLGIGWQLGALVLVYYVLGYGVYSSLMAGIGALVPSVKESGPATMLVVIPALIPLMFINTMVEDPHGRLAVILSMIPVTAPISMMIRLVQGGVPGWQIALSLLLMVASIPLLLTLVSRLFRAQTLLASETFSLRRAWAVLARG